MSDIELRQSVYDLLSSLRGLDSLKKLFWSELNYERENQTLSRRNWPDKAVEALAEDPILLASGGKDFQVIYARLNSKQLLLNLERLVVTQLLKNHPYTLFVFSDFHQERWHFINVKYDVKQEKRQVLRRITVGAGEQLRTATERLSLLDLDNISSESPLAIQERHDEAFDVEKVTKKFFEQYRSVFEKVEQLITKTIPNADQRRLFTQKLFNRLMFIVFIQKKGWLKFNEQTNYLETLWQDYQNDNSTSDKNFYHNRLTHLFFTGLNNPQQTDIISINNGGFLRQIIGTVPYLNGGLFEQDEDDHNPNIIVPDQAINVILQGLFSNFNFTVTESTPLDVEVAVDPEMLGKVFEELVTGRHESGSYYTPKPIVSFMCREALKGYLSSKLTSENKEAIELFVDEYNAINLKNPEAVLETLKQVKVCDPACGSGAYLLGMLHELLDLRQCLFATKGIDYKTVYQRKLEIIETNIYGVDIDPFAVNIARLRLWLSLAVEYEGDNPPPLPNLKFKIETGDSLTAPNPQGSGMVREEFIHRFREAKAKYLRAHLGSDKQSLEQEINEVKKQIALLTHGSASVIASDKEAISKGFDWVVEFAEVLAEGGFDIQVANPPYVRQELIKDLKPTLKQVYPEVYTGTSDLYCFFYARALQLLKTGGMLAFISSNKWFRAKYGEKLREHIADTCQVRSITDFGDLPVFKSATAYPMIFIANKEQGLNDSIIFTEVKSLDDPYPDVSTLIRQQGNILNHQSLNGKNWMLTDTSTVDSIKKMKASGITLEEYVKGNFFYGIKTGLSKVFFIDKKTKEYLINQDEKSSEIIKPLAIGKDIKKWSIDLKDRWLIFTKQGIEINDFPAVIEYLQQYRSQLEPKPKNYSKTQKWLGRKPGSYKWYEIQDNVAYYQELSKPKIVYQRFQVKPCFAYDTNGIFVNDAVWMIVIDDLYLLGILNSQSFWQEITRHCTQIQNGYQLLRVYLQKAIVPNASESEKEPIIKLVQKCLDAKGVNCEEWEKEIDERVAALYGL
ncbi:Eco57I restriction-modification methylase domain-containing protein [Microcystis aeruginosa CS-558/01A06]|uniref:site-specific DNA-methyltransferase (adenine-specific) n=1 Tax=Microcystis aeruginosa BLCC-F108 TaxID=2755317 RepID=A0A841UK48_MICAE|nr:MULTISPECIES: DNA methyltransferase [Microcystis]MBC1191062.1 Eco57I restriction-modification methylase domain-containing protein [Microcystis aeruginosa BLCC-F108]MCA2591257.1 Eco57I restriction-modification methylase domain-containing protein [Microcystis sp. M31BS1]MDB9409453.1 Eco57I restriction-modification methylase domain-containing protein [Microcystis aeruginosa CS-558/01A06]